ncbi:inner membrane protein YiaA [Entomohabitans teleogrylli]|uniref:inner membrane protein YiaA n=1 Tax=Entomohabitans teleogrylli TaxID=1384589 RepID=UPI00073D5CA2|nr:inner membrane protein YiaA [Entomohabitans teleogrylli]
MEKSVQVTSPAFNAVSWLAFIGGIVVYLIGLWRAEMQLNEKGYYFAVLVLGLFAAISLQKTVRDRMEDIPTTPIYFGACLLAFIVAVLLLAVGLWNAELLLSEKGFYGLAFFLSLFGAIAVQKNVRDAVNDKGEDSILSMPASQEHD